MTQKTQLKIDGQKHHKGEKNKRPKDTQLVGTKKKERASPSRGRKLSHPQPSNVAYMQIMKFNSNGRSRTSITHQCNLPLYSRG